MRYLLVAALTVVAACDAMPGGRDAQAEPRLSLALDVTSTLDWGAVSDIRLTLSNQGNATGRRANVELYVPSWLEFSSVEPEGTEVSVLRSGGETRLVYRLGDPALQPAETRTVVQRIRVPPRPADAPAMPGDTTAGAGQQAVPGDRTLRARLVSPEGEEMGAEIRTIIPFAGADNRSVAPPTASVPGSGGAQPSAGTDARIQSDRIGVVQLGATTAQVRAAAPGTRDTTFTLGEGMQERGLVVPVGQGRNVVALIVDDRVSRIAVHQRGLVTERGLGVGSTFQQLRQAYGAACVAPGATGGTAVWFPTLPGVSFGFDVAQTSAEGGTVPDTATVRELWVRRGVDSC